MALLALVLRNLQLGGQHREQPAWAFFQLLIVLLLTRSGFAQGHGPGLFTSGADAQVCTGFQKDRGSCPELRPCMTAINCKFGDWQDWYYEGGCTGLCFRHRDVVRFSNALGQPCKGSKQVSKDCTKDIGYTTGCPYAHAGYTSSSLHDCKWSDWSDWGDCSRTCGGGESSRDRTIRVVPHNGGTACEPKDSEQVVPCNMQPCSSVCKGNRWTEWEEWQPCSRTCGEGLQQRNRKVEESTSDCGSEPLVGSAHDFRLCGDTDYLQLNAHTAGIRPPQCTFGSMLLSCKLSDWADWGHCESECGTGERSRWRSLDITNRVMNLVQRVANLEQTEATLERHIYTLRTGEASLERSNHVLLKNLTHTRYNLLLRDLHVQTLRRDISELRRNLTDTKSRLLDKKARLVELKEQSSGELEDLVQQSITLRLRNLDLEHENHDFRANISEFKRNVEFLQANMLALETTNLAVRNENHELRQFKMRLQFALPIVVGILSLLLVLCAAWVHFGALGRNAREVDCRVVPQGEETAQSDLSQASERLL